MSTTTAPATVTACAFCDRGGPYSPLWPARRATAAALIGIAGATYVLQPVIGPRGQALAGVFFFFGLVALFSANLRAVNWRTIGWGVALQVVLALLVLKVGYTRALTPDEMQAYAAERAAALVGAGAGGPLNIVPETPVEPPTTKLVRPFYAVFEAVGGLVK